MQIKYMLKEEKMNEIKEFLLSLGIGEFELVTIAKLLFSSCCGAVIGLEREKKGRPAGLKTFSLVCMGATLAMITNEFIYKYVAGDSGDLARMAAQVISGIGFLGAGTIMVTGHNQVKGLTTAAALWMTAAIGIAIGAGYYFGGVAGVVILVVSSAVYRVLDRHILQNSRSMRIYAEGVREDFMLELLALFDREGIRVLNLTRRSENKWYKKDTGALIELDLMRNREHQEVLEKIRQIEDLRYVQEI